MITPVNHQLTPPTAIALCDNIGQSHSVVYIFKRADITHLKCKLSKSIVTFLEIKTCFCTTGVIPCVYVCFSFRNSPNRHNNTIEQPGFSGYPYLIMTSYRCNSEPLVNNYLGLSNQWKLWLFSLRFL